jgi:hypothetical protein
MEGQVLHSSDTSTFHHKTSSQPRLDLCLTKAVKKFTDCQLLLNEVRLPLERTIATIDSPTLNYTSTKPSERWIADRNNTIMC